MCAAGCRRRIGPCPGDAAPDPEDRGRRTRPDRREPPMISANVIAVAELRRRDVLAEVAARHLAAEARGATAGPRAATVLVATVVLLICAVAVAGMLGLGLPGVHAVLADGLNQGG